MNVTDSDVRNLHQLLLLVADIKGQLERGPRQLQTAQLHFIAAAEALKDCKEAIKNKKMEADRKQLQLREREAKVHEWEGKMNAAKNNREFQAIKEQIAADTQANSVLSDEILEALEEIDRLNFEAKCLEEKQKIALADKEKTESMIAQRMATLRDELARIEANLAAAVAPLPDEFKGTYLRLVSSRAHEAMAPLDDVSCGGCNTGLPPRILDKLRLAVPIPCPSCGRLLYRPE